MSRILGGKKKKKKKKGKGVGQRAQTKKGGKKPPRFATILRMPRREKGREVGPVLTVPYVMLREKGKKKGVRDPPGKKGGCRKLQAHIGDTLAGTNPSL